MHVELHQGQISCRHPVASANLQPTAHFQYWPYGAFQSILEWIFTKGLFSQQQQQQKLLKSWRRLKGTCKSSQENILLPFWFVCFAKICGLPSCFKKRKTVIRHTVGIIIGIQFFPPVLIFSGEGCSLSSSIKSHACCFLINIHSCFCNRIY